MTGIHYVVGDATQPHGSGQKVILHVCNNRGAFGAGFVLALSRRWPEPEAIYLAAGEWELGETQVVSVAPDIAVANMIAQDGFPRAGRRCALDYSALAKCLRFLANAHAGHNVSFHGPRFGCGIAGGSWEKVAELIERTLCAAGFDVTIYDLEGT